jgi:hypothetical protein
VGAFVRERHDDLFLFAWFNRLLPGRNGSIKGLTFGLLGWVLMNLIFFPLIGLGPFAIRVGLGIKPALLSLVMVLIYSIVLGTVYVTLDRWNPANPKTELRSSNEHPCRRKVCPPITKFR